MTDLLDQQITESLHRSATHADVHTGSFGDVRRRVRARRQRHVAAAVLPAVAGMAWLGTRTGGNEPAVSGPAATGTAPSSNDTVGTDPTTSFTVTPTTSVGVVRTIPADLIAHVLCVDATGQAGGSTPGCAGYVPDAPRITAPQMVAVYNGNAYIVPTVSIYQSEAEALGASLGLPVWPDMGSYIENQLHAIDANAVHVVLVITADSTTCTLPGCTTPSSSSIPTDTVAPVAVSDARIQQWIDRAGPALGALGFPTLEHKTDQDGVTKISASDPTRPSERIITITIRPGTPEVTPTTYSSSQADGGIAVKYQANDGWLYEIGLSDTGGGALPTEAQLLDIVTSLGQ